MENKFAEVPDELWEQVEPLFAPPPATPRRGRPPIPDRSVFCGIVYRLRTGCQWKALPERFGSGSACHARFQMWCKTGVFRRLFAKLVHFYDDRRGIDWQWASLDSAMVKAPKGGTSPARTRRTAPNSASNAMS